MVQEVAKEAGLQEGVVVKYMTRLNTTRVACEATPSRPRLLKVILQNEGTKWKLLQASGKLKGSSNQGMSNIIIMPDRTYKERIAHVELAKVRESKYKELQEKVIKDRKWVIHKKLKEIRIKEDQSAAEGVQQDS